MAIDVTYVVLVEDNPRDVCLIRELIADAEDLDVRLSVAQSLDEGTRLISEQGCDVVLTDLGLPDSQGLDTVVALLAVAASIPIVVLTETRDVRIERLAIQAGAQDYLPKADLTPELFSRTLRYAIERKVAETALRESELRRRLLFENASEGIGYYSLDGKVIDFNRVAAERKGGDAALSAGITMTELFEEEKGAEYMRRVAEVGQSRNTRSYEDRVSGSDGEVWLLSSYTPMVDPAGEVVGVQVLSTDITAQKQSEMKMQRLLQRTIAALGQTTKLRDPYTAKHQIRVTRLAVSMGERLGLEKDCVAGLRAAGLLHDIGKIAVPTEILTKPRPLTAIERTLIQVHPQAAYDVLKEIEFPWPVADSVLQHHERMDGTGYPNGLKRGEILLEARILAVADTVEAMSSHRPYRGALGVPAALEEIEAQRGAKYDPQVVDACLDLFREHGFTLQKPDRAWAMAKPVPGR